MKKMIKILGLLLLVLFVFTSIAPIATAVEIVTLRWDRNNEPDLKLYTVFWRSPGGAYLRNEIAPFFHEDVEVAVVDSTIMSEHPNEVTVTLPDTGYEFVLSATDDTGNESGYSNQVDTIKPQPPGGLTIWEVLYAFILKVFSWFC